MTTAAQATAQQLFDQAQDWQSIMLAQRMETENKIARLQKLRELNTAAGLLPATRVSALRDDALDDEDEHEDEDQAEEIDA
ncbi:hypothetical protein [Chitinimonas koreensis]|uniref:hypothetical protein n=1 Tax=Chitinimonas koreensis TaxID=356302 RepID=UPI0003F9B0BD|nr:hypothetical protein [Chitinimonas koreensis]QNM98665.1 hypothetical protein H9L41_10840 [Chitinimonas koreensis]